MTVTVKYPVALTAVFLWIGFVAAISFMEAWLKFQAPGITLPLGLGIGRLVFDALNKVEWVLAIGIISNLFWNKHEVLKLDTVFYFIPLFLLLIQTIWLLPTLDARAELHIQGKTIPQSYIHFYYIGFEAAKVACLFIYGISLFKSLKSEK